MQKSIDLAGGLMDFPFKTELLFVCRPGFSTFLTVKVAKMQTCFLNDLTQHWPHLSFSRPPFYLTRCLRLLGLVANLFLVVFTRVPVCVSGAGLCQVCTEVLLTNVPRAGYTAYHMRKTCVIPDAAFLQ